MNVTRIDVPNERGLYTVLIGAGLISTLPARLDEHRLGRSSVVVSCPPVWRMHGSKLRDVPAAQEPVIIPDGERAKRLATVTRIYDAMVDRRLDRSSTLIAFGGGVVGDVGGFAAATYLRGIRLVQIPTTLLAQVDSAIGGKVGVNLAAGKNLVGSFHPPALVLCDPELLRTLPRREFRAGLYEVVKYGVIRSRPLFDRVSSHLPAIFGHDLSVLAPIIAECCQIKADVVIADERDAGPRRVLNFGHTIGHALEAITNYRRFRHGEAIGYGMLAAAHISAARGALSEDDQARLTALLTQMGPLPLVADLRIKDALDAISLDKKVVNGRLHFVLAQGLGATAIVNDVTTKELGTAMKVLGLRV